MIRKGTFVVTLDAAKRYTAHIEECGKVIIFGNKTEPLTCNLVSVRFANHYHGIYQKQDVRRATKEEIRGYRFAERVQQI